MGAGQASCCLDSRSMAELLLPAPSATPSYPISHTPPSVLSTRSKPSTARVLPAWRPCADLSSPSGPPDLSHDAHCCLARAGSRSPAQGLLELCWRAWTPHSKHRPGRELAQWRDWQRRRRRTEARQCVADAAMSNHRVVASTPMSRWQPVSAGTARVHRGCAETEATHMAGQSVQLGARASWRHTHTLTHTPAAGWRRARPLPSHAPCPIPSGTRLHRWAR